MLESSAESLRADGLTVSFGAVRAVDNVTLTVKQGEILGLIGPNGAGKTTLTNALTGFQRYTGSVTMDGADVTGMSARRLSVAGIRRTFQNVRVFGSMSVAENVLTAGLAVNRSRRMANREMMEILDWFGMADYARLSAGSLPYGLERRLGIARTVVGSPRYLLLDEPAAGLDESESDDLLVRLRELPAQFGCALIVIEHDMRLIMRLCDRLQVIDHGQTLAVGDTETVRADPRVIEAYLGVASHGGAAS